MRRRRSEARAHSLPLCVIHSPSFFFSVSLFLLLQSKKNSLKDFVQVASPLGVTHFMIFSQTVAGCNLRLVRLPHGPTFTFRVSDYSNIRDIVNMQKSPHSPGTEYQHPPLLVLNNFSAAALAQAEELARQEDEEERAAAQAAKEASATSTLLPPSASTLKLTSTMFQNMFPPIDVANLQVKNCRRVIILQYEPRTSQILLRHYLVTAAPVGLNKGIKKLIKSVIPDLSNLDDIADFVKPEMQTAMSDSEAEDAPDARITLPQSFHGRGNRAQAKSAIRLHELGPRASLQLLKVEEEMDGGKVLYHYRRSYTEAEAQERAKIARQRKEEKARRRAEQQANVDRKAKRKRGADDPEAESLEADPRTLVNAGHDDGEGLEDEAAWYRREVGEEPQEGLFDRDTDNKADRAFPLKAERRAEAAARAREEKSVAALGGASDDEDEEGRPKKKKKLVGSGYGGMSRAGDEGNKGGGGQGGQNVKPVKPKASKKKTAGKPTKGGR